MKLGSITSNIIINNRLLHIKVIGHTMIPQFPLL